MSNARSQLADGIQDVLREQPDVPPEGVILRFVLVAEYAVPATHGRSLAIKSGDASGQRLPSWDVRGLISEVDASIRRQERKPPPDHPELPI